MAKEKEKVMIVTGCNDFAKVVAIAVMKMEFVCIGLDLQTKNTTDTFEKLKETFVEFEKIEPVEQEVRESPIFYKKLNVPINSKPFKPNIKFDRTARNAI